MLRLCMQAATAVCVLLVSVNGALAQPYPTRTITLIHPFQPGDIVDIFIRSLEPRISAELGRALVIDYRPGAGGITGAAAIAKAPADGYTIGIAGSGALAISPHFN